jgi:hypothetical protein
MINVMTLRQFYERREITEMKWVHEANNSVDSMTKIKSSSALKTMIDINEINLNIIKWVERATTLRNDSIRSGFLFSRIRSTSIWFLVDVMWFRFDVISNFNDLNSKNIKYHVMIFL